MKAKITSRSRSFPINKNMVDISPFRGNINLVKEKISQYKNKNTRSKVGFTFVSSLKSMGLIPRADGKYTIGEKYRRFI
jgi:hypothetical protein